MKHIISLDVGTTTVRAHVLNESAVSVGSSVKKVELIYPKPSYVEIDPDHLWQAIVEVLREAVKVSGIDVKSIACLGIATQRSSFISWNIETGKYYHRFITWKDLRADSMVRGWNSSFTIKSIRFISRILYTIARDKRFLAASVFQLMNTMVTLRLCWALKNISELKEDAATGKAVFGGVECWLLYKLTGKHISDVSNASATGLFDPFRMAWADWGMSLFKIPETMFPNIVDCAGKFGNTPEEIFGVPVPITCCMADQAASLFGSCCFGTGDLKLTMGTGAFLNVNSGGVAHASIAGLYPVVGWRMGTELVYSAEGSSSDTGTLVEWLKSIGMMNNPSELVDLVESVDNSDGVYFIPAFSGLQAPINDPRAATGFLGVKPTSGRAHLVRAVFESIVFRILLLYEALCKEMPGNYTRIRVDGGVSQNDFILQLLSDLTGLIVERATTTEISILGVAFVSGLECEIWKNKGELENLKKIEKTFEPNKSRQIAYQSTVDQWKRAMKRFQKWYS